MQRNSDHILTEWLVLNAQSGKAAAMDQLLRIWYPRLLRYSMRQLGDREAAQDMVQETLVTVAKKIVNLKDPVAFPKWAYQILHRRGIDYQRTEIRRRSRETDNGCPETPTCGGTPAELEIDASKTVRDALAGLDGLSYNVIYLFYLDGLSLQEIATICCIPVGTVKSRLHTARGKLRKLLVERL